jgi:hypothetical protein
MTKKSLTPKEKELGKYIKKIKDLRELSKKKGPIINEEGFELVKTSKKIKQEIAETQQIINKLKKNINSEQTSPVVTIVSNDTKEEKSYKKKLLTKKPNSTASLVATIDKKKSYKNALLTKKPNASAPSAAPVSEIRKDKPDKELIKAILNLREYADLERKRKKLEGILRKESKESKESKKSKKSKKTLGSNPFSALRPSNSNSEKF